MLKETPFSFCDSMHYYMVGFLWVGCCNEIIPIVLQGILDWVLDTMKKGTTDIQSKLSDLQKDKERVSVFLVLIQFIHLFMFL